MNLQELQNLRDEFIINNEKYISLLMEKYAKQKQEIKNLKQQIEDIKIGKQGSSIENKRVENCIEIKMIPIEQLIQSSIKYFNNDEHEKIQNILKYMMKYYSYYTDKLSEKNVLPLLIIAHLEGLGKEFICYVPKAASYLQGKEAINRLCKWMHKEKKVQLYDKVVQCVNHFILEEYKNIELPKGMDKGVILKRVGQLYSPYCESILMLPSYYTYCPKHNISLKKMEAFAALTNK